MLFHFLYLPPRFFFKLGDPDWGARMAPGAVSLAPDLSLPKKIHLAPKIFFFIYSFPFPSSPSLKKYFLEKKIARVLGAYYQCWGRGGGGKLVFLGPPAFPPPKISLSPFSPNSPPPQKSRPGKPFKKGGAGSPKAPPWAAGTGA